MKKRAWSWIARTAANVGGGRHWRVFALVIAALLTSTLLISIVLAMAPAGPEQFASRAPLSTQTTRTQGRPGQASAPRSSSAALPSSVVQITPPGSRPPHAPPILRLTGGTTPAVFGRHGTSSGQTADTPGTLAWESQPLQCNCDNWPAVANNTVYFCSGLLYAFSETTGAEDWGFNLPLGFCYNSSPAVANGIVYVGSQTYSGPADFFALDASTGQQIWAAQLPGPVTARPAVANGVVYVSCTNGTLYALNASDGTTLWSYLTNGPLSPPTVTNNLVYFGSGDTFVYALNTADGSLAWKYQTQYAIDSSPVVSGGLVYIGSEDRYEYALDAATGNLDWKFQTDDSYVATAEVANGVVYVASHSLYALNASSGALIWQDEAPGNGGFYAAPTVVDGNLYIGSEFFNRWALSAASGAPLWVFQTDTSTYSKPAVANGLVFWGPEDSKEYAIYAATPDEQPATGPQGTERLGAYNPSENGYCLRCSGDPVDNYSGNFTRTFSDFSIPGRGLPLAFSRTYNAQAAATAGPLGYGWSDNLSMALRVDGTTGDVTIAQENGSTVAFTPNGSGGYTPGSRVLATLTHDITSNTYTFQRSQERTRYIFNASGQLTQELDRNGYATTLAYDGSGQLNNVTDSAGRSLTLSYDGGGRIIGVHDPLGRSVAFSYDGNGNLTSATDVAGGVTTFTYDANHLLLTMTDPRGGVTTNVYDGSDRVTSQTDPMERTTNYAYASAGGAFSTTTITDPDGFVTLDEFSNGLLFSETRGYSASASWPTMTWTYLYDPATLGIATVIDPLGHATFKNWDANGNLLSTTDPLGRTTTYTYDTYGDQLTTTDPLGVTTTNTYDANGNLLSTATPLVGTSDVQTTTYTYGDAARPGDVTTMTDSDGHTTHYGYNVDGDTISMTDPLGDTTSMSYNIAGWKISQTTARGNQPGANAANFTTTYSYDNFGDLTQVVDPLGGTTTTRYDANRNVTQTTDAGGHTVQNTYDADNELTQVTRADGSTLTYAYDGDGNQTQQTGGLGHTTTYTYDALGDILSVTDPLGRVTQYTYNAGLKEQVTSGYFQTTYGYDAADELTQINGSGFSVQYTYDADGQRSGMTDNSGGTTYTYDSLHRLTAETTGAGRTVRYAYDLIGNVAAITYPNGRTVTHTFDAAGREVALVDWLGHTTRFAYDPDGDIVGEALGDGVSAGFTFDDADRLDGVHYGRPAAENQSRVPQGAIGFVYTRDPLGHVTSALASGTGLGNETYSYSAINQVTALNSTTYAYDHDDNVTQLGAARLTYDTADEAASVATAAGTTTLAYDPIGDRSSATTGSTTISYFYDSAHELTNYNSVAQYTYNGDGLRMSKSVGGVAIGFTWDTTSEVPLLLEAGNAEYIYGPDGLPLEQITPPLVRQGVHGGGAVFFAHDQLGSTRALFDASGALLATYSYDAYGAATIHLPQPAQPSFTEPAPVGTALLLAGQYVDAETGFIYLRARYYDPATGQFLTPDPQAATTHETYAYAGDNPINRSDPRGQSTFGVCYGGSVYGGAGGGDQTCVSIDNSGNWAVTNTESAGVGSPSASLGVTVETSDADSVTDLGGTCTDRGISGGDLGGSSGYQYDACNGYSENEFFVGMGTPGIGYQAGVSDTEVWASGPLGNPYDNGSDDYSYAQQAYQRMRQRQQQQQVYVNPFARKWGPARLC